MILLVESKPAHAEWLYSIEVGTLCYSQISLYIVVWNFGLPWTFPTPIQSFYLQLPPPSFHILSLCEFSGIETSKHEHWIGLIKSCCADRHHIRGVPISKTTKWLWKSSQGHSHSIGVSSTWCYITGTNLARLDWFQKLLCDTVTLYLYSSKVKG